MAPELVLKSGELCVKAAQTPAVLYVRVETFCDTADAAKVCSADAIVILSGRLRNSSQFAIVWPALLQCKHQGRPDAS